MRLLEDFFAVVPPRSEPSLDLLASACTTLFDAFRAPMSPQERARRIALGLNRSQIQNLDRWGDPYVLSEFRFHLTLTGKLPARRHKTIQTILLNAIRRLPVEREIAVDRLALLKQESPEANFRVVSEASLAPRADGRR